MSSALRRLNRETRRALIAALADGRIGPPFSELMLKPITGAAIAGELNKELGELVALGLTGALLLRLLQVFDEETPSPLPGLVWTGPEDTTSGTRDTGVVVRSLFQRATERVIVAGFAVYQGTNVFSVLAERMDASPGLAVDLYLNVERPYGDTTESSSILRSFAERFRDEQWPGERLPRVYCDPRALELLEPGKKRAALHAKCVVVDMRHVLISSANFTEAAQERNIEVGIELDDPRVARELALQFDWLVKRGHVQRVPGF